jgi:hypothetical protein
MAGRISPIPLTIAIAMLLETTSTSALTIPVKLTFQSWVSILMLLISVTLYKPGSTLLTMHYILNIRKKPLLNRPLIERPL